MGSEQVCASGSVLSGLFHLLPRLICFPPIFVIGLFLVLFVPRWPLFDWPLQSIVWSGRKSSSIPQLFCVRVFVTWFICTLSVEKKKPFLFYFRDSSPIPSYNWGLFSVPYDKRPKQPLRFSIPISP